MKQRQEQEMTSDTLRIVNTVLIIALAAMLVALLAEMWRR